MIKINLQNVEELLFKNSEIKNALPELRHIFDKWLLSYRLPTLSNMRKEALIEMLNSIDAVHLEKIANQLGDMIFIEQLDYSIIKNLEFSIKDSIGLELTKYESFNNIAISRNASQVYITIWR